MFNKINITYGIALNTLKHSFDRNRQIIIHHGLMGNAKNFRTISKTPQISSLCDSQLLDCRNHGSSPHTETHSMTELADDLHELIQRRKTENPNAKSWKKITLMGHSMGGIALMAFTMKYPELQDYIDRVIIIDIPCKRLHRDPAWIRTSTMLESMLKIDLNQDILKVFKEIQNKAFNHDVANLMKSNIKVAKDSNDHQWNCNLKTLVKESKHIGEFDLKKNDWRKPVEVIYGDQSPHIDSEQIKLYKDLYPQMDDDNFHKIEGGGHWVHFDKTKQFLNVMRHILNRDQKF